MKSRFLMAVAFACLAQQAAAAPCNLSDPTLLRPDLVGLTPTRLRVSQRSGVRQLSFTTLIANKGDGPLSLTSHADGASGTMTQILSRADGSTCEVALGTFPVESNDRFVRLPNYAHYFVRKDNPITGAIVASGSLKSFCIADIQPLGTDTPRQVDSSCIGPDSIEGLSVNWADSYDPTYPEQTIFLDTTAGSVAVGTYFLVVEPDPYSLLVEKNPASTANFGVISVDVPPRIGSGPVPPAPSPLASATPKPTATRTSPVPATPTGASGTPVPTATASNTPIPPSATPLDNPTPTRTVRSRPTARPRPSPRPRPTLSRTRIPRDGTPTATAIPPTATAPAATATAPRTSTAAAPTRTATATPTTAPTDSGPQSCPGVPVTCPAHPACKTGNRLGKLYFAYPGTDRVVSASGYLRLNQNSNGIHPSSEPASLALVDMDSKTVISLPNLHFEPSGDGWVADTGDAIVTLTPSSRGYTFTLRIDNPMFPPGYFSVFYQMCLSIGDDGIDEQIVCQQKPNDGFLCHSNGPTF